MRSLPMATESDKYTIKTVSRCFQILDFASQQSGPISIQDVCAALSITQTYVQALGDSSELRLYDEDPRPVCIRSR